MARLRGFLQADPADLISNCIYACPGKRDCIPPAQFAAREKSFMPFSSARSGLA